MTAREARAVRSWLVRSVVAAWRTAQGQGAGGVGGEAFCPACFGWAERGGNRSV
jgi:hypothetical protein